MEIQQVHFEDMGLIAYKEAWDYQEKLLTANTEIKKELRRKELVVDQDGPNLNNIFPNTHHHFLFCEHPPVYTLGKSGHLENILIGEEEMERKGIEFFQINRGGDITFHGPEQIVGYPILDLEKFFTDIGKYMRSLEEIIIRMLAHYEIEGGRSKGETGVWIAPEDPSKARKICAMGIRCSRWITMHGFALNVNTDLDYFNYIIPCGIANKQVTSMEKELGRCIPLPEVKERIQKYFCEVFEAEFI